MTREVGKGSKAKRLKGAKISVGELSGFKPDSLRLYLEEYSRGTPLEGATLDVTEQPETQEVVLLSITTE